MSPINWSKEQITPEQFFKLPRDERLKIITRHIPFHIKIPFFLLSVSGVLINCLVSAFAGTTIHNSIISAGNTEFTARFWSLALALFFVQALNAGMDRSGKWLLDKIYREKPNKIQNQLAELGKGYLYEPTQPCEHGKYDYVRGCPKCNPKTNEKNNVASS